jgi:hypothetical protein
VSKYFCGLPKSHAHLVLGLNQYKLDIQLLSLVCGYPEWSFKMSPCK